MRKGKLWGPLSQQPAFRAATPWPAPTSPKDAPTVKYGQVTGFARMATGPGDLVPDHSVCLHSFSRDDHFGDGGKGIRFVPEGEGAKFIKAGACMRRPMSGGYLSTQCSFGADGVA